MCVFPPTSKHWFTTSFLQPLPYFIYTIGSRKLTSSFFVIGAQTVVSLLQTTRIISDVCFITDHVACASSDKTKIIWIRTHLFFFFTWGGCTSCLHSCLGVRLPPQHYQYPNLSEGTDHTDGQLHRDKQCPFSGVTEGAGKWCSECVFSPHLLDFYLRFVVPLHHLWVKVLHAHGGSQRLLHTVQVGL